MLATVDLNDDAFGVTGKISNVSADPNLATEVATLHRKTMAQVPPKLPLGFRRCSAHFARELTLWGRLRAILLGPDARLFGCGHVSVTQLRPPPLTPPHKGEGNRPSVLQQHTFTSADCYFSQLSSPPAGEDDSDGAGVFDHLAGGRELSLVGIDAEGDDGVALLIGGVEIAA